VPGSGKVGQCFHQAEVYPKRLAHKLFAVACNGAGGNLNVFPAQGQRVLQPFFYKRQRVAAVACIILVQYSAVLVQQYQLCCGAACVYTQISFAGITGYIPLADRHLGVAGNKGVVIRPAFKQRRRA
jgi:hypothetical protein